MTRMWVVAIAIGIVIGWSGVPATTEAALDGQSDECLALMMPAVQGVPGSAEEAASGVRDLISKYLAGPSVKIVPLESRYEDAVEDIPRRSLGRAGGGRLFHRRSADHSLLVRYVVLFVMKLKTRTVEIAGIIITRNDRTRVWATSSSRRRLHYADRAQYGAVSGSAACSSSATARPRNPSPSSRTRRDRES